MFQILQRISGSFQNIIAGGQREVVKMSILYVSRKFRNWVRLSFLTSNIIMFIYIKLTYTDTANNKTYVIHI